MLQTVAKLQKADKSRLNLSSETLVFLQRVFWHAALPVSTNKLFWDSETRCPQGYTFSQNLQKNFSSCVFGTLSPLFFFSEAHGRSTGEMLWNETSKHQNEMQDWPLLAPSTAPPHMLDMSLYPPTHPSSESMSAPGQHPGPLTNRVKQGEIAGKTERRQADDSEHTLSEKTQTADTHTRIRKPEIWKGSNGGCLQHA